ncbi:hypothetical protein SELMODRAFT_425023 [Selaginella moellendorffii]|uniref:Uncharacterized protein n=1 Tax=Selaginella moellendorffii TaxID=88036 RepID=D8SRS4_SELML|nr:hypothetical protein SELMODRAFT_425023 [Selaginella moellendorffii]
MDDPRVWICYGGEPGFFWRAIHNTFPLSAVQRKWQLAAVYVENTAVRESSSMRDLLQLGCGTGTREDPLIIRGELATDAIAQELFYCQTIPRQVAAFTLTGDRQVQLWQIARHFGLWPWTAWIQGAGREGKLFIDHVQRSSERRGSPEEPFQLRGYYGPFSKGDVGSFRSFASSDGVLDLELGELLHISFSTSVYSASMISGGGEEVVLKLDYDPGRNLCAKIGLECAALADLRDAGIMSRSLPVLVRRGFYRPSGSLSLQREYGEVSGIVTKPRAVAMGTWSSRLQVIA